MSFEHAVHWAEVANETGEAETGQRADEDTEFR